MSVPATTKKFLPPFLFFRGGWGERQTDRQAGGHQCGDTLTGCLGRAQPRDQTGNLGVRPRRGGAHDLPPVPGQRRTQRTAPAAGLSGAHFERPSGALALYLENGSLRNPTSAFSRAAAYREAVSALVGHLESNLRYPPVRSPTRAAWGSDKIDLGS